MSTPSNADGPASVGPLSSSESLSSSGVDQAEFLALLRRELSEMKAEVREGAVIGRGVEVGVGQCIDRVIHDGSIITFDGVERLSEMSGVSVKEREKRVMEAVQLTLQLTRDLITKAHTLIR